MSRHALTDHSASLALWTQYRPAVGLDNCRELTSIKGPAIHEIKFRIAALACGILNLTGLNRRLLGRNTFVCQIILINLQRYALFIGGRTHSGLILLLRQLLLETIVGAHAEVIRCGVDGPLGAETTVSRVLWARCCEA